MTPGRRGLRSATRARGGGTKPSRTHVVPRKEEAAIRRWQMRPGRSADARRGHEFLLPAPCGRCTALARWRSPPASPRRASCGAPSDPSAPAKSGRSSAQRDCPRVRLDLTLWGPARRPAGASRRTERRYPKARHGATRVGHGVQSRQTSLSSSASWARSTVHCGSRPMHPREARSPFWCTRWAVSAATRPPRSD